MCFTNTTLVCDDSDSSLVPIYIFVLVMIFIFSCLSLICRNQEVEHNFEIPTANKLQQNIDCL